MIYESDIEKYLCDQVKKSGGLCIKIGYSGLPDRLIVSQGRVVWVELKREDGRLSKQQEYWIAKLKRLGQEVFVPFSRKEVDEMLCGSQNSKTTSKPK